MIRLVTGSLFLVLVALVALAAHSAADRVIAACATSSTEPPAYPYRKTEPPLRTSWNNVRPPGRFIAEWGAHTRGCSGGGERVEWSGATPSGSLILPP
jgi:hypothetical protein